MRDELGLHDEHTEQPRTFGVRAPPGGRAAGRPNEETPPTAATLLRHAVDLRDADDADRLEIAWVLGFALADSGSIPEARELLSDAIVRADAANNERAAAYARCAMATVQMLGSSEANVADLKTAAERAARAVRGRWGRAGSGPGMVHDRVRAVVRGTRRGVHARRPSAAMVHARAAGDRVTEGDLLGLISACNALGPTALDEGIAQSDAILDEARATGNRRLEQSVLRSVGTMYSMKGAFDRRAR